MQTSLSAPDTSRLKIVLYQVRPDADERAFELAAFTKACGLDASQVVPVDVVTGEVDGSELDGASAAIIGGSAYSVFEDVPHQAELVAALEKAKERKLPVLAVCYGAQLVAQAFGGEVVRDEEHGELGTTSVRTTDDAWTDIIFADVPDEFDVQEAHRDRISKLPHGAVLLAENDVCPIQAFAVPAANVYATQFHPERTKEGFEQLIDHHVPDHYKGADTSSVKAGLRATPEAQSVVRKFIERIAAQKER